MINNMEPHGISHGPTKISSWVEHPAPDDQSVKDRVSAHLGAQIGKIIALKDGTAVVEVVLIKRHKLYNKQYKSTKKFHAQTKSKQYKIGDTVKLLPSRPQSALKRWILEEIK